MANMLEGGGKTPLSTPEQLEEMGFKLCAYPLSLLGVSIRAMELALEDLHHGNIPKPPAIPTFDVCLHSGWQQILCQHNSNLDAQHTGVGANDGSLASVWRSQNDNLPENCASLRHTDRCNAALICKILFMPGSVVKVKYHSFWSFHITPFQYLSKMLWLSSSRSIYIDCVAGTERNCWLHWVLCWRGKVCIVDYEVVRCKQQSTKNGHRFKWRANSSKLAIFTW